MVCWRDTCIQVLPQPMVCWRDTCDIGTLSLGYWGVPEDRFYCTSEWPRAAVKSLLFLPTPLVRYVLPNFYSEDADRGASLKLSKHRNFHILSKLILKTKIVGLIWTNLYQKIYGWVIDIWSLVNFGYVLIWIRPWIRYKLSEFWFVG